MDACNLDATSELKISEKKLKLAIPDSFSFIFSLFNTAIFSQQILTNIHVAYVGIQTHDLSI